MKRSRYPVLLWIVWVILGASAVIAMFSLHWSNVFVSITALLLTILPITFSNRLEIQLPKTFLIGISLFVFATLFLGEVFDFYNRFWWWDILLHAVSATGFGIVGFLFVFYLFKGDRFAAPPWALAMIAFCVAMALGALWELFEFGMDQLFGLNMQKSGLVDTMTDLLVDAGGALIGAISGFFWLKGQQVGVSGMIEQFVRLNRTAYAKLRDRAGANRPPDEE